MDELRISIKYAILVVGLILSVVVTVLFYFLDPSRSVQTALMILGTGIALTTLVYAAHNLKLLHESQQTGQDLERKRFSADLIRQYNSPEMTKLTVIAYELKKDIKDLQPGEVVAYLQDDSHKKEREAMVLSLNFFERMAIAINHGIADEDLLKDFFRGIVRNNNLTLKGFIELRQRDNPKVWEKFQKLATKWEA